METENAESLFDEGLELIELEKFKKALGVANQLKKLRYSGGFEIEALAYAGQGNIKKAIKTLKGGVKKCPDVWTLWQLLGNHLSDIEQFEEAIEAFDSGLEASKPNVGSLILNKCIALARQGSLKEALSIIQPLLEPEQLEKFELSFQARLLAEHFGFLNASGEHMETKSQFEALSSREFGDDAGPELSMIWCEYSRALHSLGSQDDAEQAALKALYYDNQYESAQRSLREIRSNPDQGSTNYYRLMLHCSNASFLDDGLDDKSGYYTTYYVAADSEDEAYRFTLEFEFPEAQNWLSLEESTFIEQTTDPKGVYRATGKSIYTDDTG